MRVNSYYILVFAAVVAMFFVTQKFYNGSGQNWVGLAQAKDYTLSSEKQAAVVSIRVVQGQTIKAGDTLITLMSQGLSQDMEKLQNRIRTLQSEKIEKQSLVKSDIDILTSANAIEVKQIEQEITQAEAELKINKNLTTDLNLSSSKQQVSPLEEKIKSLREEIALRNKELQIKINDQKAKNATDQSVLQNQIELLENEYVLMNREKLSLAKLAPSDGVVESIYVKEGEQLDAYTRLISILPKSPTSAIGYLGTEKTFPPIGTKVQVLGYEARWKSVDAKVIGYGAVTALPEILQKATAVKAFGKEIFIELPAQNDFSTGEKLLVRLWEN
jgi:multidrug resistance efflux pump